MTDANNYFLEVAKALKFSQYKRERIEVSIEYFKEKIWGEFKDRLAEVMVFGSYSRDTIINKDSEEDVDIAVIYKMRELQPDTYLKQIKTFCQETYHRSTIFQDHPTIVLDMDHTKFEIVPSIYVSKGCFKIPSPKNIEQKWLVTNPKELIAKTQKSDRENKNLILPTIRILKYWNILNERPFRSFQIERAIIDRTYTCSTIREFLFNAISAIDGVAKDDKQKTALKNLRDKLRRVRILETHNFSEYAEQELESLLPFP